MLLTKSAYHPTMSYQKESERRRIFIIMVVGLPAMTGLFLWLKTVTEFDFFFHLAAIPLEILLGAFLVQRYLAQKDKDAKQQQLMYFKSYLFRSDMRNVFISNFRALTKPAISLEWIRSASLAELKQARAGISTLEYRSPAAMEEVLAEYIHAEEVWRTFLEWAASNDFEPIFHDMLFILHFIQDMELFKKHNPNRLFAEEALASPRQRAKMDKVLRDGIEKFLDYVIELREKVPEVFEDLLEDYLMSAKLETEASAARD